MQLLRVRVRNQQLDFRLVHDVVLESGQMQPERRFASPRSTAHSTVQHTACTAEHSATAWQSTAQQSTAQRSPAQVCGYTR